MYTNTDGMIMTLTLYISICLGRRDTALHGAVSLILC